MSARVGMVQFKEIGRISVTDNRDVVLSQVLDGKDMKGLNINSYLKSEKFTGFTKGTFIPEESIEEFGELVRTALAQ